MRRRRWAIYTRSHLLPCGLQMLIWVLFPLGTWRVNCRPMWHSSGVGLLLIRCWVSPNGCTVCDVMWACILCRVTCKFKSQLDFYWMFGFQKISLSGKLMKFSQGNDAFVSGASSAMRKSANKMIKLHLIPPQTPANTVQLLHKHLLFWFEPSSGRSI